MRKYAADASVYFFLDVIKQKVAHFGSDESVNKYFSGVFVKINKIIIIVWIYNAHFSRKPIKAPTQI